jgi:hypothetical protein
MKVKCLRLTNEQTGTGENSSGWLDIGIVYHVLCLLYCLDGTLKIRLMGKEQNTPVLFDIRDFEIVSPILPPSWVLFSYPSGVFELTPKAWTEKGFWDAYFEHDPNAMVLFEEERRKIIEADP